MQKYTMTCSCGLVMETEASSKDDAVTKFKGMMSEDAIKAHMADKHKGEPVPTKTQADMMIEQNTKAA
jgi:hypothetical protein